MNDTDRIPAHICCGLLLAAGQSRRFRRSVANVNDSHLQRGKLLAPLPSSSDSVAERSANNLEKVLERVIAIVPEGDKTLANQLAQAGCEVLIDEESEHGMGSSLAACARYLKRYTCSLAMMLV